MFLKQKCPRRRCLSLAQTDENADHSLARPKAGADVSSITLSGERRRRPFSKTHPSLASDVTSFSQTFQEETREVQLMVRFTLSK